MSAYTTQLIKETVYTVPSLKSRVSQLTKEIIYSSSGVTNLTQIIEEVIYPTPISIVIPTSGALTTQFVVEVLRNTN